MLLRAWAVHGHAECISSHKQSQPLLVNASRRMVQLCPLTNIAQSHLSRSNLVKDYPLEMKPVHDCHNPSQMYQRLQDSWCT
jgi:hypothetical protein